MSVVKMVKEELAPGITVYKAPKEQAISLLEQVRQLDTWIPWGSNYGRNDPDLVACSQAWPQGGPEEELKTLTDAAVSDFAQRNGITKLRGEAITLFKYGQGNFFKPHIDDANASFGRVVSVTMTLNDDFTGGELEFERFNVKIKPESGNIVVFISSSPYYHEVHPIVEGTRYAAVRWYRNQDNDCFK